MEHEQSTNNGQSVDETTDLRKHTQVVEPVQFVNKLGICEEEVSTENHLVVIIEESFTAVNGGVLSGVP